MFKRGRIHNSLAWSAIPLSTRACEIGKGKEPQEDPEFAKNVSTYCTGCVGPTKHFKQLQTLPAVLQAANSGSVKTSSLGKRYGR